LQKFATVGAQSLQCAIDFLVMAMLTVASAAIGNSRRLRIRRGYEEAARIYAAIIAPPGAVKSPALRLVCGPVYEQQKRLMAHYRQARELHAADMEEYELKRRAAMKSKDPASLDLEKPIKPIPGHVFVENYTIESLARILTQAPRGIVIILDEMTKLVRSENQYRGGRGTDRQVILSSWSGEPMKVDRKGDGDEPLMVTDPFISVIGCIPPAKLPELDAGNEGEDGFIHRILFVYPRPVTGRHWSWEGIKPETRKLWSDVVDRLYALEMEQDEDGDPRPKVLDLAPEACPLWEAWYNEHLAETEQPDFPDALVGPWSKLVSYAAPAGADRPPAAGRLRGAGQRRGGRRESQAGLPADRLLQVARPGGLRPPATAQEAQPDPEGHRLDPGAPEGGVLPQRPDAERGGRHPDPDPGRGGHEGAGRPGLRPARGT
jgi:hypothetical protein